MRFAEAAHWRDPWPSEMTIATTVDDEFLLQYLFVRSTYGLETGTRIPEVDPAPPDSKRPLSRQQRADWKVGWDRNWRELWSWRHRLDGCRSMGTLDGLFARIGKPPLWPLQLGDYFDRDAFAAWKETLTGSDAGRAALGRPEGKHVEELAGAWRRGLHEIVVLPYLGEFSRSVEGFALEVSRTTYLSPTAFPAALRGFA